jgi:hypothetical protein
MNTVYRAFLVATVFVCSWAWPSDEARKPLLDHLDRSSSEFLESIQGLTPEQWNYKPAADAWSIAECAEHIILSEDLIRDVIESKVLAAPATKPIAIEERKANDQKVLQMVTNRQFKAKAPEQLQPTRTIVTPEAAFKAFRNTRGKTVALAKSRSDLREHVGPHPVLKELDAHQWLLYLSGHTMRHTAQIVEVKAAPGFPRGR